MKNKKHKQEGKETPRFGRSRSSTRQRFLWSLCRFELNPKHVQPGGGPDRCAETPLAVTGCRVPAVSKGMLAWICGAACVRVTLPLLLHN